MDEHAAGRGPVRGERGSVTAEFAMVMPAVLLVLACCLGGMQLASQQLRLQDAAAIAARLAARGDDPASARGLVPGSSIAVQEKGELTCATAAVSGGGGVLGGVELTATSCALR